MILVNSNKCCTFVKQTLHFLINIMKKQDSTYSTSSTKGLSHLAVWTFAWVASMALASFGPRFLWNDNLLLSIIAISLNVILGLAMIFVNKHYFEHLDELQRKIQLEAMGITLGLAVVLGLAYSLLDQAKVISYNAEISHVVILIGLTYLVATFIGNRKYL